MQCFQCLFSAIFHQIVTLEPMESKFPSPHDLYQCLILECLDDCFLLVYRMNKLIDRQSKFFTFPPFAVHDSFTLLFQRFKFVHYYRADLSVLQFLFPIAHIGIIVIGFVCVKTILAVLPYLLIFQFFIFGKTFLTVTADCIFCSEKMSVTESALTDF